MITALVEGNSIRSVERMTSVHRDTIIRLLHRVGSRCEQIMDQRMRDLKCRLIQADEIWCYVGKKQAHLTPEEKDFRYDLGSQYVFVALDPESKLVPVYEVGKRDATTTWRFALNLAERLSNHVQLTTDSFSPYYDTIDAAFGSKIDYGQLHKSYRTNGERRYSPPDIVAVFHLVLTGKSRQQHISTSHVERQNLTMRVQMRRFTRLTNGFSKTLESLKAAVALHFAHYNFVRIHGSLRVTPAMEARVTNRLWSIDELIPKLAN